MVGDFQVSPPHQQIIMSSNSEGRNIPSSYISQRPVVMGMFKATCL